MCIFLIEDSGEETGFSHFKSPYNNYYCIRRIDDGAAVGTNESACPYLSALEECPDFKEKNGSLVEKKIY
ncbi:MAG: hypothetical protein HY097_10580 [Nitrospinae bacterium]|nr:hypothetical protein [Nitrospinota bacterium]MBI3813137.1 hypothetical protein [Nitrospinota bacterium]